MEIFQIILLAIIGLSGLGTICENEKKQYTATIGVAGALYLVSVLISAVT